MSKHERSKSQEDVLRHPDPKRAKEIDKHSPLEELQSHLGKQKTSHAPHNVLHWFRSKDLRAQDNRALAAASKKADESNESTLLTAYLFSPKDMEWHGTSAARTDFILESLRILKAELAEKHIPLVCLTAPERSDKISTLLDFAKENAVSHVYANLEYEVDELRRDIKLAKHTDSDKGLSFTALHDQTVVEPGELKTGAGTPHKVFTPYHKEWVSLISKKPSFCDLAPEPTPNDATTSKTFKALFDSPVPDPPESKRFASKDDEKRIRKLWPAGHSAATGRLEHFLKKKAPTYARDRSEPAKDISSRLSPYFASGVLSVREALQAAARHNDGSFAFTDGNDPGIAAWVREIVFREFYRHVLVGSPHTSMNLPQNLKFENVEWEEDEEGWYKWCEGKTGMPFVDAGMRQLAAEAYMHNRLRMNVSSYLYANLLLDYRRGERFFAERLVDWDLANNTQGWEPSYTVFNPVAQAERLDRDAAYIKRWVPELRGLEGKAVFDPHARLARKEFEKLGYPAPHVDFNKTKARATERFKVAFREADF